MLLEWEASTAPPRELLLGWAPCSRSHYAAGGGVARPGCEVRAAGCAAVQKGRCREMREEQAVGDVSGPMAVSTHGQVDVIVSGGLL